MSTTAIEPFSLMFGSLRIRDDEMSRFGCLAHVFEDGVSGDGRYHIELIEPPILVDVVWQPFYLGLSHLAFSTPPGFAGGTYTGERAPLSLDFGFL